MCGVQPKGEYKMFVVINTNINLCCSREIETFPEAIRLQQKLEKDNPGTRYSIKELGGRKRPEHWINANNAWRGKGNAK